MDKMRSRRKRIIIYTLMFLCLCLWGGQKTEVLASVSGNIPAAEPVTEPEPVAASITFGSRSYSWNTGEVSLIGVYASSSEVISSYEISLEYDSTMLRYLSGASEQEGNLLYLRGSGNAASYSSMLRFEPLQGGDTTIRVVSATCMTARGAANGNVARQMTIAQLPSAPVAIEKIISSNVTSMQVSPGIISFSQDVYEYSLTVEADVEELALDYTLEDDEAQAELSDTGLEVGENTITLTVRGSAEDPLIYTIKVIRKEPEEAAVVPVTETMQPSEPEETIPTTEAFLEETIQGNSINIGLWIGSGILLLIVVAILLFSYTEAKKRKQEEKEREDKNLSVINLEETVIEVQNVTMRFRMAKEESSSLKEFMIRMVKGKNQYRTLTALKNISFEVKQGDVVGIIGTNGSGKSTLLKMISGVLKPSGGRVLTDRNKIQMLTLGTGFDMELTARENVYLNGAIIGYTKEYIDEKYDDIVAFAELDGFMEERMKKFSSGMVSRLGFAIATMRDAPDILILDEVLSVGDLFFRQKSEKRIKEMIHSGATVLIVSHSMDTIKKNCNKVVWIEKGVLQMVGEAKEVCSAYAKMMDKQIPEAVPAEG